MKFKLPGEILVQINSISWSDGPSSCSQTARGGPFLMKSSTKLLSSAAMTNAVPASSSSRNVVIHVFDEYRKSSKEFTCQRDLLLAKMKYFQAYLNEANEHDEIDISALRRGDI
ncbi:Protein of unknown function DUF3342 [Phytophthora cactorum]|nr:Protein of unknown function DUF3342 [Phytophthora cactorum]